MEKRFKLRISCMFRSCRCRNIVDTVHEPVFTRRDFHLLGSSSPKARSFPFFFRSKHLMKSVKSKEETYEERRRASETGVCFSSVDGRRCPPGSPVSPPSSFYKSRRKEKIKKPMKKKRSTGKETVRTVLADTSSTDSREFFSSDDERDEEEREPLFSSKGFSSESSETRFRHRNKARKACDRSRKVWTRCSDVGVVSVAKIPMLMGGKVRDSFAVVKSSRDPNGDFRNSMLEMILEKQIFAAEDLEQLLHCFLSLNSPHHHQIIIEVFSEIWEALFHRSS